MDSPVTINAAESKSRHPVLVGRAILHGFSTTPYTAYRLALKDVKGAYAKTSLGLLWDLADPLMFGAIFYFLVASGTVDPGTMAIPYALFVTYGMLLYLTFTEALLSALRLFRTSRNLLSHVKLAPEALILSVFFRVLFNSSFRILVMLGLTLFMTDTLVVGIGGLLQNFALFLLLYPLLILSGMSIGLLLAPFNAIYSDVERIVALVILPLRFATPVFFNITSAAVILINPVAVFIVNMRQIATHQGFYHPGALLFWCGIFTVIFVIGTILFHLAVPVLAERA